VDKWPVNPLDVIIEWIKKQHPTKVIGDFGCGDARLAASVSNQVYSFDLVAKNDTVTACDIAHVRAGR
jgi:ribosomal RNA-processing protein 8